jgi:hypothetical protein
MKKPAHDTAGKGLATREEKTVAIEPAASCTPLMRPNSGAAAIGKTRLKVTDVRESGATVRDHRSAINCGAQRACRLDRLRGVSLAHVNESLHLGHEGVDAVEHFCPPPFVTIQ